MAVGDGARTGRAGIGVGVGVQVLVRGAGENASCGRSVGSVGTSTGAASGGGVARGTVPDTAVEYTGSLGRVSYVACVAVVTQVGVETGRTVGDAASSYAGCASIVGGKARVTGGAGGVGSANRAERNRGLAVLNAGACRSVDGSDRVASRTSDRGGASVAVLDPTNCGVTGICVSVKCITDVAGGADGGSGAGVAVGIGANRLALGVVRVGLVVGGAGHTGGRQLAGAAKLNQTNHLADAVDSVVVKAALTGGTRVCCVATLTVSVVAGERTGQRVGALGVGRLTGATH